jgi:hypothetical protein
MPANSAPFIGRPGPLLPLSAGPDRTVPWSPFDQVTDPVHRVARRVKFTRASVARHPRCWDAPR